MTFLNFVKSLADSDKEFLAIIEEMESWVNKDDKKRIIRIPHGVRQFQFSKDEYEKALETAKH